MLAVPTVGGATINRRYTIRRIDRDATTVDLEIVVHGEGPGARWASSARPGAEITAIGPRGRIVVAHDADWHLFAADESGVPATLAMLEALPHGTPAVALLDVADDREVRADRFDDAVDLRWLVRGDLPAQHSGLLLDAVRELDLSRRRRTGAPTRRTRSTGSRRGSNRSVCGSAQRRPQSRMRLNV